MAWFEVMQFLPADFGTKLIGAALAAASAAFPLYIYNNPERFGPPRMEYAAVDSEGSEGEVRTARFQESGLSIIEARVPDPVGMKGVASSTLAGKTEPRDSEARPELDGVMTGTVAIPRLRQSTPRQAPADQPFPGDLEPVNLLFVSSGGALVMEDGGIEIIGEGSQLPDGSRVLSIRERDGSWEILTTGERVLRWRKS